MQDRIAVFISENDGICGVQVPQSKGESADVLAVRFAFLRRIREAIRRFDAELRTISQ
jgi:hypothetical protein